MTLGSVAVSTHLPEQFWMLAPEAHTQAAFTQVPSPQACPQAPQFLASPFKSEQMPQLVWPLGHGLQSGVRPPQPSLCWPHLKVPSGNL